MDPIEEGASRLMRGLAMDAPRKAELGPPRHRHGPRAARRTCCTAGSCATTRPTRSGPTATGSSCRPVTPRSCSTRICFLTGYGLHARRPRGVPPVRVAHARSSRARTTRQASRSPPARSVRASPTASAWPSPSGVLRARFGADVIDHHTFVIAGDGCCRRASATRRPRWPATWASAGSSCVYDDNHITIDGDTEPRPRRRRRRSGSRPTAGTSSTSARWPTTSTRSRPRVRAGDGGRGPPVAARAAQPHRLPLARTSPTTPRPTATRSPPEEIAPTKEILGLPRTSRSGRRPTTSSCRSASAPSAGARRERAAWQARFDARFDGDAGERAAWDACWDEHGRGTAGRTTCPTSSSARRSPPARPSRRRFNAVAATGSPAWCAAPPTSPATPARSSTAAETQSPEHPGGRQIHFGIREHAMGAALDRHGRATAASCPSAARSSCFSDYMRPASAPGRARAQAKVDLRVHPRLGRPRRGRPDPPADRAAGVAAGHAPAAGHPPGRRQRDRRRVAHRGRARRAHGARPQPAGRPRRDRRHGRRVGAAPSSRDVDDPHVVLDRHRQRGVAVRRRPPPCSTPTASRARVVSMPSWDRFAGAARRLPRRCCPPACPCCRSRRPRRSAGPLGGRLGGHRPLRRQRARRRGAGQARHQRRPRRRGATLDALV